MVRGAPDWATDYEQLTAKASADEPPVGAWDDDNLFIMYTSGTTGRPKGAVHSHDGMLWSQLTSMSTSDMRDGDRWLLASFATQYESDSYQLPDTYGTPSHR